MSTSTDERSAAVDVAVLFTSLIAAGLFFMEALTRLGKWGHGLAPGADWLWGLAPLGLAVVVVAVGAVWIRLGDRHSAKIGWLVLGICCAGVVLGLTWLVIDANSAA